MTLKSDSFPPWPKWLRPPLANISKKWAVPSVPAAVCAVLTAANRGNWRQNFDFAGGILRQIRCRILLAFAAQFCATLLPNDFVGRWCLRFPLIFRVCVSITFYGELNVQFSISLRCEYALNVWLSVFVVCYFIPECPVAFPFMVWLEA